MEGEGGLEGFGLSGLGGGSDTGRSLGCHGGVSRTGLGTSPGPGGVG
jgi:hypothetical protein